MPPYKEARRVMEPELAAFLASKVPRAEDEAVWGDGAVRLRVSAYVGDEAPPLAYVTSVRCVVLRDGEVLVQRDRDSTHLLPGGRRETGETLQETLRREVREETGWTVAEAALLGFLHFHHESSRPPGYAYPYPDFLQAVFTAEAVAYDSGARLDDGYELESVFHSLDGARSMPPALLGGLYLDEALRRRAGMG